MVLPDGIRQIVIRKGFEPLEFLFELSFFSHLFYLKGISSTRRQPKASFVFQAYGFLALLHSGNLIFS